MFRLLLPDIINCVFLLTYIYIFLFCIVLYIFLLIKHGVQPSALFARDHAPGAIFSVTHEREQYFNWFIVAAFLASAALNGLAEVSCPQP